MTPTQKSRYTQKIDQVFGEGHRIVRFPKCIAIMFNGEVLHRFRTERELLDWLQTVEKDDETA